MYHTLHKQNKSTSKKIQAWRIKMFAVTLQELRVQNLLGRLSFTVVFPLSGYCRKDSRHHTITWQLSLKKLSGIRFTKIQLVGQYLHQTSRATAYRKGNWTQVPHLSGRALSLLFRQSLSLHTILLFIKNKHKMQEPNYERKFEQPTWKAKMVSYDNQIPCHSLLQIWSYWTNLPLYKIHSENYSFQTSLYSQLAENLPLQHKNNRLVSETKIFFKVLNLTGVY